MRDAFGLERWRALGRVLPRRVRERVFEPALGDLMHEWIMRSQPAGRLPFGLLAIATLIGCLPLVVRTWFVRDGRVTRLGHALAWGGTIVVLVVLVLSNMYEGYAANPGP